MNLYLVKYSQETAIGEAIVEIPVVAKSFAAVESEHPDAHQITLKNREVKILYPIENAKV